jgi:hypothetical protein
MTTYRKKLIKLALPLEAINTALAGEKPDFGVTSVNYDLEELLERSESPA